MTIFIVLVWPDWPIASPIVITTKSPLATSFNPVSTSSTSRKAWDWFFESLLKAIGCTPLNNVTLLSVASIGVIAKIGVDALVRDIDGMALRASALDMLRQCSVAQFGEFEDTEAVKEWTVSVNQAVAAAMRRIENKRQTA